MLSTREKTQKLIAMQLDDLSDTNIGYLYNEMMSYLQGQKRKEIAQEYLQREAVLTTSVVCEGARIEVQKIKVAKLPVMKTKRPRIQKPVIDSPLKIVLPDTTKWMEGHLEGLKEMYSNHVSQ